MDSKAIFAHAFAAHQAGDLARAEEGYRQLLAAQPGHAQLTHLMGALRGQQGRFEEALALLEQARAGMGHEPALSLHVGNALQGLGRHRDAVAAYDQALALKPDYAEALGNKANALGAAGRSDEALQAFAALTAMTPRDPRAWYNRGSLLLKLDRHAQALADFNQALALGPDLAQAWNNQGNALRGLGQHADSLAAYAQALALQPGDVEFAMNHATALLDLGRHDEALAGYDAVLARDPDFPKAWGEAAKAALYCGDWDRQDQFAAELAAKVKAGAAIHPLVLFGYVDDPASHRRRAEILGGTAGDGIAPLWQGERYKHARTRIAYVSHDLRDHPVGQQLVEVLERHDHSRFEIIAVSTSADDGGVVRPRIKAACDQFHDMTGKSSVAVATLLRELETDIAIDLNGYTQGGSINALSARPAPLMVDWLGYAGTTGTGFMDAVLVDDVAVPPSQQAFFRERLVALPHSFFPMDTTRVMAPLPDRAGQGLPAEGFVFCCFNSNFKITRAVFDIWMRLLKAVPGSVLWLRHGNTERLQREAQARGVAAQRLVFAGHVPADMHLARHRLADLFLDTAPYNAHATAADALWAGLPVLTRAGASFPARVAASLVTAAGTPELATHTEEDYEALALALARDPARLKDLQGRLVRRDAPLFDTARLTRDLETALTTLLHEKTQP